MALLLNILWNIPGLGFLTALMWLAAALVMAITVIGLPWARACLTLAGYSFLPFGNTIVTAEELTGRPTLGTGPLGWLANIIWFLVAGIWLCIAHLTLAGACAVTIVGLPFAWAHLKLAAASLAPVGKRSVPNAVGEAIAAGHGRAALDRSRR
ncbi:YccF domain-containing protein [Roseomonas haemaphysalidis]|uniref:Inner membrane protein YccF n=1 Tax=Roseomonas haemaphysalidis TaxID=2768162 RepID=A0ABS3KNW9_9PROT|nr:YccF domain-containing protein [Roseomonas haemaphysalidis]MBO1079169.1 YccF domain-containing protein [Roseomonas haemaphysalidis]